MLKATSLLFTLVILAIALPFAISQDEPEQPTSQPAAAQSEEGSASEALDPSAEWKKLSARKYEIARQVKKLSDEFYKSDDARKKTIRDEFNKLITEYRLDIEARMRELAEGVYEKDPSDVEAAELVMTAAMGKNRYHRALEVAEAVLEAKGTTKYAGNLARNVAGAACFAINEFDKAREYLKEAEKDGKLDSQFGRRYLSHIPDYIEFWTKEQELRKAEAALTEDERLPRVELVLQRDGKDLGRMELELFENEAPNTVANFISIVESGKYEGIKYHRVIDNFMAQTGDFEGAGKDKLPYTIKCECWAEDGVKPNPKARKHFRGSVSMALSGQDTGNSQFFITHTPTYWLNFEVDPKSVHTVFGRVVDGMDVVDEIEEGDVIKSAAVLFKRNHEYKPKTIPLKEPASKE